MLDSDFTERTRAEKTLTDIQQGLEFALHGNIGLWSWNLKTDKVYFSPEWKTQLGYEDHELQNRFQEWETRLHPEDRHQTLAVLDDYLKGQRPDYELEFRLRHKDGSYRWIFARAFLQADLQGKLHRLTGFHLDITEHKKTEVEKARRLARERIARREADNAKRQLSNIVERVSDAFVALDRNWRYTYVNQQAAELFGRQPGELLGRHIWTEFPEGVGQPFHLAYEKAMAEQVFIRTENYYEPWNRWFENRIYPSSDGLSIFFHEITERKQAEQEAHEGAELLKGQNRVLELVAQGAPLQQTLDLLLCVTEAQSPGMLCSILLLDSEGLHVRHGAAPSLPESFTSGIDGGSIGPRAGSCGTAAFRRERVVVEDIATDPLWEDYRELALRHGLRACWSTPICDGQKRVLGTFALYFRTPGRPSKRHSDLIEMVTHTAAIAIVKHRETEALRASEERLRLAVAGGNVGIWEWDVVTNRLGWSDQLKEIYGRSIEGEVLTSDAYFSAIHPEDRFQAETALKQSLANRSDYRAEYRILRPDGSLRWIAAQGRAAYDIVGQPVRMTGVAVDISDRKRAEEETNRRQGQLAEAQRIAQLGSYEWDVHGNTVHRSEELCSIFGVPRHEFEPTFEGYLERIHPEDRNRTRQAVEQAFRTGTPFDFEERIVRPDGVVRVLRSQGKWVLDKSLQPTKLVGICQDITERKQAEEQLRRTEERALEILEERVATRTAELQSKNQELEHEIGQRERAEGLLRARNEELKAFAYTVSHDLKAPLRGIAGYAQELDRQHHTGLGDRALFCLKQILTATSNLDRLIEDLLHYSRLDAETPSHTEVNVAGMVEAILRDRKPLIVEQKAEVMVRIPSPSVRTWERGLLQVLTNLIDNALKYSRDANPPMIQITTQESSDAFRIKISDNGIGFDMRYHDRIFGLFNRLVRQEEYEGTGAGLAIAKKVVEKLGGKIWAEAKPGLGSEFFVQLPKKAKAAGTGE